MKINKNYLTTLFFILIVTIGIIIRFYQIEQNFSYGWDQSRDAYQVSSLLNGKFLLEGPKTGIGNFNLGPLYFYLLAPFFFFTHFDPIASQYLNLVLNASAFIAIFYVTKKLFSVPAAFLVIGMYMVNTYVINSNKIPWNVSLVPLLSFFIFYFIYKTFKEKKYKWSALLMTSCGIFFHTHFTAVVFPLMICALWLVSNDRLKLLYLLITSLPFYIIWFIPTIIDYFVTQHSQYYLVSDFFKYYFVGFHLQFIIYRLPDVLIQFKTLLSLPAVAGYFMLFCLGVIYFFTTINKKLYIKIIFAWLLSTLFVFGIYGGPISDYYFFFTLPVIFYTFTIFTQEFFRLSKSVSIIMLITFLLYYGFVNLKNDFTTSTSGLSNQKASVKLQIKEGKTIPFNEGDINSYLYLLYTGKL